MNQCGTQNKSLLQKWHYSHWILALLKFAVNTQCLLYLCVNLPLVYKLYIRICNHSFQCSLLQNSFFFLGSCETAFEDGNFDYAVNCACETKLGQTDPVYKEGVYKVSINCATAAAKHGVKRFIEVSSGKMASSEKVSNFTIHSCSKDWSTAIRAIQNFVCLC